MADELSIFSVETQQEEVDARKKAVQRTREKRRNDDAFYKRLVIRLPAAEYGANAKWDRAFGKFPVYVDVPGFGLCVTTRGRWKDYQGKEMVHWGLFKINPFVSNDEELRSEYFEIPTKGAVGNIGRKWVIPIPFTLIQFRLDDKNRGASELVFCRAQDCEDDEFECKVMRLDDFLRQVKADTKHKKGYRVLMDALRMEYPKEVEKYMVLETRLHGNSEGPARIKHASKKKHSHRSRKPAPYTIVMPAQQAGSDDDDTDDDSEDDDADDKVTDLNTVDKRIGWGFGLDNQIDFEESAAAGSAVNGDTMDFVKRYRMARYIDRNSSACKIRGIMQCSAHFPNIPRTLEARMTALSVEQSRTARLLADGGDPTRGSTWSFSLFDV